LPELQVPSLAEADLALVAARRNMIDESNGLVVGCRGLQGPTGRRSGVQVARRVVRSGCEPDRRAWGSAVPPLRLSRGRALAPRQQTLDIGTQTLVVAALAWLAPTGPQ